MNNDENKLILKILEYKIDSSIDEIKVDLKRVCEKNFGNTVEDNFYIEYLFKYYSYEINIIREKIFSTGIGVANYGNISLKEDIKNYLIKIAIIRLCNKEFIKYQIERLCDIDYCINLIDDMSK